MSNAEMESVVSRIRYKDWTFRLVGGDQFYLQVSFDAPHSDTGAIESWGGRKWLVSRHMTPSEIVQTALKAVLAAEEHEAREQFTYRGRAIFGPHFDVERLVHFVDVEQLAVRAPVIPSTADLDMRDRLPMTTLPPSCPKGHSLAANGACYTCHPLPVVAALPQADGDPGPESHDATAFTVAASRATDGTLIGGIPRARGYRNGDS